MIKRIYLLCKATAKKVNYEVTNNKPHSIF